MILFICLLVIQLSIFGGLALLLRYVLTRHIREATAHLQQLTQDHTQKLEEAKKLREEAEKYYQDTLQRTQEEADKLKRHLLGEGETAKKEVLQQAHEQAEAIMQRAKTARDIFIQEIEQKIAARAREKTERLMAALLPGKMAEETHSRWVEELIRSGLEGWSRLNVPEDVSEAEVVTAFPLKPHEKAKLQEQLNHRLGRAIRLKEEVDPQLIFGLRVTLNSLVMDGSFQFRMQEFLRHVESENPDAG